MSVGNSLILQPPVDLKVCNLCSFVMDFGSVSVVIIPSEEISRYLRCFKSPMELGRLSILNINRSANTRKNLKLEKIFPTDELNSHFTISVRILESLGKISGLLERNDFSMVRKCRTPSGIHSFISL
ncbi:hypothetical protein FRX31_002099 [Thalictrum thalictroides]|uniref:Uncharacterized protein n=1 Tax=Thalictrum thalictroides TaxID=46969 RepID=A0A7J6XF05_THATH|nr:hypothetical protein FRX31_002099 [Thalictrum thalictroides]